MRNEVTVQAIILSVLSVPLSACAEPDESVERSVAFIDREMHIIHAEGESDSARARDGCRILVNKVFDLDAMARGSLPEMWDSMEPDQHDIFRSAFAERMTTDCVRQITEHGTETLKLLGIDKFATARLGPEDFSKKIITWHLRSAGPELWVAIDMLADGRSIVLSAHDEYSAILQAQNGDIDALIAALQRQ